MGGSTLYDMMCSKAGSSTTSMVLDVAPINEFKSPIYGIDIETAPESV